ncbi:hypothetical protein DIPPA_60589 [Diplonema papillatum]|nr:hypothetical protein DIPPA_52943 [Diplonema papillatum]KAJ9451189.1 hypothetical protein DIPPA_52944 [Diplonema papillatum]KAJ9457160.1 hypothetical protein DIPPA_60589 [Diplonema papillatum]
MGCRKILLSAIRAAFWLGITIMSIMALSGPSSLATCAGDYYRFGLFQIRAYFDDGSRREMSTKEFFDLQGVGTSRVTLSQGTGVVGLLLATATFALFCLSVWKCSCLSPRVTKIVLCILDVVCMVLFVIAPSSMLSVYNADWDNGNSFSDLSCSVGPGVGLFFGCAAAELVMAALTCFLMSDEGDFSDSLNTRLR